MPILPKFNIKNLVLLGLLLIVSSVVGLVGKLIVNKTTSSVAQAQCWSSGAAAASSGEGSEGGSGAEGGGDSCGCGCGW